MCDTTRIADIIQPEAVRISDVHFRSKGALFRKIASVAEATYFNGTGRTADTGRVHAVGEDAPTATAKEVANALNARSRQFPVGLGNGVLLPTGHLPGLRSFKGVFLRLKHPARITTPDGKPADLVFALLGRQDETRTDLQLMAYVAHTLRGPKVLEKLRRAVKATQLYSILTDVSLPPSGIKRLPSAENLSD